MPILEASASHSLIIRNLAYSKRRTIFCATSFSRCLGQECTRYGTRPFYRHLQKGGDHLCRDDIQQVDNKATTSHRRKLSDSGLSSLLWPIRWGINTILQYDTRTFINLKYLICSSYIPISRASELHS